MQPGLPQLSSRHASKVIVGVEEEAVEDDEELGGAVEAPAGFGPCVEMSKLGVDGIVAPEVAHHELVAPDGTGLSIAPLFADPLVLKVVVVLVRLLLLVECPAHSDIGATI